MGFAPLSLKLREEKAFSASSCRKTLEIRLSILPRGKTSEPDSRGAARHFGQFRFRA
jgi:hypothetical protein